MKALHGGSLLLALCGATAPAQQTWIVDPAGTGNFTDLAAAIAAAGPDDTLLLRGGGTYSNTYTLNKPLHLVGVPPQRPWINALADTVSGAGLTSLRNIDVHSTRLRHPTVFEAVHVASVTVGTTSSFLDCIIGRSAAIYPTNSPALAVYGGDVLVRNCTVNGNLGFAGGGLFCVPYAGIALSVQNARATISGCSVFGSDSGPVAFCVPASLSPGGPAIHATNSQVAVTQSTVRGGNDYLTGLVASVELYGGSSLQRDASVAFTPPTSAGTPAFIPATDAASAPPGGAIHCEAQGGANLPAVLVAGLGLRPPVSTPYGAAWIDPVANVILRIGFTDGAGRLAAVIQLPVTAPRNLPITVQALVVPGAIGALTLGTPVVVQVL